MIHVDEAALLDALGQRGEHWSKDVWDEDGMLCLHGAIRRCAVIPGDAQIIQQVAIRNGWGPEWNDRETTTWADVRERCAHVEVTDAELSETFGPQWEAIVALTRRAFALTPDERKNLSYTRKVGRFDPRDVAWSVDRNSGRALAAWDAVPVLGLPAIPDAALALAVRHLIDDTGRFTRAHYDELTAPWRLIIGVVHPDDDPEEA